MRTNEDALLELCRAESWEQSAQVLEDTAKGKKAAPDHACPPEVLSYTTYSPDSLVHVFTGGAGKIFALMNEKNIRCLVFNGYCHVTRHLTDSNLHLYYQFPRI